MGNYRAPQRLQTAMTDDRENPQCVVEKKKAGAQAASP